MSESKELCFNVSPRRAGSSAARRLRRQGQVPAVVYGRGGPQSLPLSLDIKEAQKYIRKDYDNKIFTFQSRNKDLNNLKVLKKQVTHHPLTRVPLHIDFFSLDMGQKVRVQVEVRFEGRARGVKESGGLFSVSRRNVEVECLPAEIPDFLSIDVTDLSLNQILHVANLKIPTHIKLITSKESPLCAVTEVAEEESKKETPAAAAATSSSTTAQASPKTPASAENKAPAKKTPDSPSPSKSGNKKSK